MDERDEGEVCEDSQHVSKDETREIFFLARSRIFTHAI